MSIISESGPESVMGEQIRINWYRTPIDKELMSRLMKKSDLKGLRQCLLHLSLFILTATITYLAYLQINAGNWYWSVPLMLFCLFWHGTFAHFIGSVAVHELTHKTPFRTQALNDFFMYLFAFLSWYNPIAYRASHVRHHQVTTYHDLDGEIILPQKLDWGAAEDGEEILPEKLDWNACVFIVRHFLPFPDPFACWNRLVTWVKCACDDLKGMPMNAGGVWWTEKIFPESNLVLRRRHRTWACVVLLGHLVLAAIFIATGHWFLVIIINCSLTYAGWLVSITGLPQHIGMKPDTHDFRFCCRTYTCNWLIGFIYWNMQYHVEHHMFPAVPFYNLPALRKAIEHDLPPAPHGLVATWREIIEVLRRQHKDAGYYYVPEIPGAGLARTPAAE